MKIIIAGAGDVGTHLAKMLSKENQDITLLDSDQTKLDVIDSNYNLMTWNGSTSSFDSLREVGVKSADLYIAVTPYETRNLASCAIAKKMGARKTVARIDNSEFLKPENRKIIKELGVDNIIYPEHLAANDIAKSLSHAWTTYWGELHEGELLLIGVKIPNKSILVNVKLKDLPVTTHDFHIAAITRKGDTIIPNGNQEILEDDIVYFITTPPFVEEVREICGKKNKIVKKAMIVGATRIAKRFSQLYHDKFHIRILENDMALCERFATDLPDCEIINGDGRDIEVLRENNIYQYDAFIALTESSETNILTCLTAKEFGVYKTIAEVENLQFVGLADNLDIGNTINKKLLTSSRIYKILLDADESNSKFFAMHDAEVAEIYVRPGAKITKAPVKDLKLPYGMTLAALVRDKDVMLIDGNTQINSGDYVVVFSLMGTIEKIEKWFN